MIQMLEYEAELNEISHAIFVDNCVKNYRSPTAFVCQFYTS
jgi:hypothetical protein